MIIVSNTSPISNLAKIDHLFLLQEIYSEVIIPQALYDELTDIRAGEKVNNAIKNANFIKNKPVINYQLVKDLQRNLDRGESEAIVLAIELNANKLLIDERLGRQEAIKLGLSLTGVLSILLIAKKRGLINNVKSLMDKLISHTAFRIGDQLYYTILIEANEN
jgi:predicted nucleic acid-binding protein